MKTETHKASESINPIKYLITLSLLVMANPAFADLAGGISKATGIATQVKNGLLAIFGIVAVIYLLIKAVECWSGRAEWKELGLAVLYVAMAGGAAAVANWAWTAFL